jgi:hypothetical protein
MLKFIRANAPESKSERKFLGSGSFRRRRHDGYIPIARRRIDASQITMAALCPPGLNIA